MIKKILLISMFFANMIFICKTEKDIIKNETPSIHPKANVVINNNPKKPTSDNKNTDKTKTDNKKQKDTKVFLNFDNISLSNVVTYIAERKKIDIIYPKPELKAQFDNQKVSLTTHKALSLDSAWDILLTLLELNNFTIVNVDGIYRVASKADNSKEPLPFYSSGTGTEPEDLPESDLIVRYVYFLKNIQAQGVKPIIDTMLDQPAQINADLQAFIITDKCINIKAAMAVIKELDQGGLRESIKVIKLNHTNVNDIKILFDKIIPKQNQNSAVRFIGPSPEKPSSYFSSSTRIIPDTRNNSLILLGTEKGITNIINFIQKNIDIPLTSAQSRLHIKELKYAKAQDLIRILKEIVKRPAGEQKTEQMGQYKFFEDVHMVADSQQTDGGGGAGNRLVISCNKEDWIRLSKFIDKLDKPQPQVAFEVMIVKAFIERDKVLDATFKPKNQGLFGKGTNVRFMNQGKAADISTTGELTPITINQEDGATLTLGKYDSLGANLWAVVQATLKTDNFNVIAQPFLVTNNNSPCTFDASSIRWVPGKLNTSVGTQPVQSKNQAKARTVVKLTPEINSTGQIALKIVVDSDDYQSAAQTDANRDTRKLDTKVVIGTGEVLTLGGLTKDEVQDKDYKTPILGDIPILGNFFKAKSKVTKKTTLYIFIRPSIIKPELEGGVDEYTQLKLDYAKRQIINADTYYTEKDPIQRWFFKPEGESIKQTISDARKGIYRPIDNFAYGSKQPRSVDIRYDDYYRAEEGVQEEVKKILPAVKFTEIDKKPPASEKIEVVTLNKPKATQTKNIVINRNKRIGLKSRLSER